MKTAQEWMLQLGGEETPAIVVNRQIIREIQLDAMKEGMRRAADLMDRTDYQNAITDAAKQSTEENL